MFIPPAHFNISPFFLLYLASGHILPSDAQVIEVFDQAISPYQLKEKPHGKLDASDVMITLPA